MKGTDREKEKASGMGISQENLLSITNKTTLMKIRTLSLGNNKALGLKPILILDQHEQFHGCLRVTNAFYCSGT